MAYILTLVSVQCFQDQCMLWVPGLDVQYSDPGICQMFPGPVYVVDSRTGCPTFWPWYLPNDSRTSVFCGFLGWMSYIWPWYLTNVSRTSVCCRFPGWMTYILTLVSAQYSQVQCMLWVPGLDGVHFDPGICPIFPGPVLVVGSWAGWPTFWPWYLPNVSRTSVCWRLLGWMAYILTLVSAQGFPDQCMLWIPGLDGQHFDPCIFPMFPGPVYVVDSWAGWPTFWPWCLSTTPES